MASPLCLLVDVEIREQKTFQRTRESIMKRQETFISILFTEKGIFYIEQTVGWIFLEGYCENILLYGDTVLWCY